MNGGRRLACLFLTAVPAGAFASSLNGFDESTDSLIIIGIVLLAIAIFLALRILARHKTQAGYLMKYLSGTLLAGRLNNLMVLLDVYDEDLDAGRDVSSTERYLASLDTAVLRETVDDLIRQNQVGRWAHKQIGKAVGALEAAGRRFRSGEKVTASEREELRKAARIFERVASYVNY